jgi:pimeloyl-ACP methyl ester carboxylesterase
MAKNPGDYGLEYENVSIETEDGVTLAAWLMKGSGDGVVVIGHPGTFTKYGYSMEHGAAFGTGYDHDVEFVPAAKHLVEAGYSVLMYDQRNHGESGPSPNGGPHDPPNAHWDVLAVVTYASEHPDLAGKDIGLLSMCQSSLVAMVAMSKEPDALEAAYA